ncbi:MAG: hypothetical protein L6R38_008921, partial [Xanthoria sp. 2 TBL-2021]
MQASPVYDQGNAQQATVGPTGNFRSSRSPTIALDSGIEVPAETRPRSNPPVYQGNAHQVFDQKMSPTRKRKRRQFSPSEKERIKYVRKIGACCECKLKKCKCTHVAIPSPDGASPHTSDSDFHEPFTPESDHMPGAGFSQDAAVKDYSFEDLLNFDLV